MSHVGCFCALESLIPNCWWSHVALPSAPIYVADLGCRLIPITFSGAAVVLVGFRRAKGREIRDGGGKTVIKSEYTPS